jgi:type I restriction enzyme M protein
VEHNGEPDLSLITRSSDGQLLFLVTQAAKAIEIEDIDARVSELERAAEESNPGKSGRFKSN